MIDEHTITLACAECGAAGLPAATRFCPQCGHRLADAEPTAETTARKTATLVFCDLADSTRLGERLDPEALRTVLGRYFAVARDAMQRHGGTVEKFVGDAVLAVFGVPEVREDDALRALRAAAELIADVRELAAELAEHLGVELDVRVGVNTGPVVVGAHRAGGAFATGDAVNVAARLQQAAGRGEVLLGATTLASARDAARVEPVAPIAAKGKTEPVLAYRLVDVLGPDEMADRPRPLARRLIGRERPAAALREAFERAVEQERCETVTVLGAAGIGKSTLVEHVLDSLAGRALVLTGRCLSYGTGIAFLPIVHALRQATGLDAASSAEDARAALDAALDGDAQRDLVVERLLPLLGLGGEPGVVADTFWAVGRLLDRLMLRTPVVLAVDDAHWADPLLLDLLDDVRHGLRDAPLLLVVQGRPDLLDTRPSWGGGEAATTFTLDPLPDDAVAELVADSVAGLPAEVATLVARWAGGVPLFARELVTHLVDAGRLRPAANGWTAPGVLAVTTVPPGLTTLLAARLDRLPTDQRELLARASVIGVDFTAEELAAVGADVEPDLLAQLQRRDLIRRRRGTETWSFRHVLVREAAYDAMPKAARAATHERFAGRLADRGAGAETAALVAHHLTQARELRLSLGERTDELTARLRKVTVAAMTAAAESDNLAAASSFAAQAVGLAADDNDRRELLFQHAMLAQLQQDADAVRTDLAALPAGGAETDRLTVDVLRRWSEMIQHGGNLAEGATAADRLAARARADGDSERVVAALLLQVVCELHLARFAATTAIAAELAEIGGPRVRRYSTRLAATAAVSGPMPVPAALELVMSIRDDPALNAGTTVGLDLLAVTLLAWDDRIAEAETLAATAVPAAIALGAIDGAAAGFSLAFLHFARGDADAAIAGLRGTIVQLEAAGHTSFASTQLGMLALLLLRAGRPEAVETLRRAAEVTTVDDIVSLAYVAAGHAILAARAGDAAAHDRHAADALAHSDRGDALGLRGEVCWWLAQAAATLGRDDRELALLREARRSFAAKGCRSYVRLVDARLTGVASVTAEPEMVTPDAG